MAEILGKDWRSRGTSWTTIIWTPLNRIVVGKTIRGRTVGNQVFTDCLEMLLLGTNWETRHSMVCQQTCKCSNGMDSSLRQTIGKIDFAHSSHKWLPTILASALSTGFIPRLRLCWRPWGLKINFRVASYVSLELEHSSPISWMCKKQTSVSLSSTESEIISLDAGLRMDGLLALDLWDVVIQVLRSTNSTARPSRLAQGNLCGTRDHSNNKTKTKTPTEKSKRDVDQSSNVDYVPTNTHRSQSESQLYIFEDNEAVIKMIIKGRSPTMRHVSRTHRVALDWLFDRIKLEPKIQIKHVDTNNQLADMPTKESFTRDEWNHLLLFFFCSISWVSRCSLAAISAIFFLIRSESRAPCQREVKKRLPVIVHRWQNRSQWFQRRREPSIWCHTSPWSARENPPQEFGYPVNLVSVDEGYGCQTSTKKLAQTIQSPEVECSRVKRQENAQNSDSWKQGRQGGIFELHWVPGKLVRAVTPRTEFQNMNEVHKPSIHDEGLPLFAKEVGNYSRVLRICIWSFKDLCVDMENIHVFVNESSRSSWTMLSGESGSPQKDELQGNSEFIQYHTEIDIGACWRDSECAYDWKRIPPSWTRSTLSHDQVIQSVDKSKSPQTPHSAWGRCTMKNSKCPLLTKNCWDSMENQLNWVEQSPRIFVIAHSSEKKIQHDLRERNVEPEKFTDWIIFMSMFNDIDWTKKRKRWNFVFRIQKKSRNTRRDSRRNTGRASVLEMKRNGMELSQLFTWKKMGLYSNPDGGTFQRYRSSSMQEYQCFESCNSEAAEYQRHHTLQCGCFKHRALVPNHSFCKSAQYLRSSFELVWTIRFDRGRTRFKKDLLERKNPWPKVHWQLWNHKK